jgi:hypothetical protein
MTETERARVMALLDQHQVAWNHGQFDYDAFRRDLEPALFGTREQMAEVKLENCRHGVDGCFVKKGEVRGVRENNE